MTTATAIHPVIPTPILPAPPSKEGEVVVAAEGDGTGTGVVIGGKYGFVEDGVGVGVGAAVWVATGAWIWPSKIWEIRGGVDGYSGSNSSSDSDSDSDSDSSGTWI